MNADAKMTEQLKTRLSTDEINHRCSEAYHRFILDKQTVQKYIKAALEVLPSINATIHPYYQPINSFDRNDLSYATGDWNG